MQTLLINSDLLPSKNIAKNRRKIDSKNFIKMCSINEEDFKLHIDITINVLKENNLAILDDTKNIFITLMGYEYFIDVLTIANQKIDKLSPETSLWVKKNLDDAPYKFNQYNYLWPTDN